jgi:hypothetical protein
VLSKIHSTRTEREIVWPVTGGIVIGMEAQRGLEAVMTVVEIPCRCRFVVGAAIEDVEREGWRYCGQNYLTRKELLSELCDSKYCSKT